MSLNEMSSPEEYEILKELSSILSNKDITNFQLMQIIKNLNSVFSHVRVKCLQVIGKFLQPTANFPCGTSSTFEIIRFFTQDNDSRVRETAFELYFNWLNQGFSLPDFSSVFELLQTGSSDPEDQVVITCLELVVRMANKEPDLEIEPGNIGRARGVRLADRAFSCVASALTHASSGVRRNAAALLARVGKVSESLLLETLEKTVMKDRLVKRSVCERANAANRLFWIDELTNFQTKKTRGDRSEIIETPEEAMAVGGITGALICGLEDDFYEIRLEAIKTIGKLSMQSEKFALSCQDLLVDMLTDDIEAVRSNSVDNLTIASGIKQNMTLRTDQLDIVLSILSEKSGNMRRSIHQLLGACRLASAHALMRLVEGLLKNLKMYEMDRDSIWRCSAMVGKNHPELVQVNLNMLLQMHPYLVFQDPSKSDPAYITVLLMVVNASRKLGSIKTSFPTHVTTNEIYLSELVPHLIFDNGDEVDEPVTKQMKYDDTVETSISRSHPVVSRLDLYSYLTDTARALNKALFGSGSMSPFTHLSSTDNLLRLLLRDLRQIGGLCDETRGSCLWLRDFGQLARLTQRMPMALGRLQEGRYIAYKMIYAYTGIPSADINCILSFIGQIDKKIQCIQEQSIRPTRETTETLSTTPCLSDLRSMSILACLNSSLDLIHSQFSKVVQVTARQLHPTSYDTERSAHKFCAGMCLSLSVRAEFSGLDASIDDHECIKVKTPVAVVVNRPDGMSFYWQPPDHCWSISSKEKNDFSHNLYSKCLFLDTDVPLSFSEWSEPGLVHLGLAVLLPNKDLTWKLTDPVGVKIYPIAANKCL